MRPVVDRAVLQIINQTMFTGADIAIQNDGVCRLNPELARRVAQLAMERCDALPYPKRVGGTSADEVREPLTLAPSPSQR
jgi:hypothetical protein